MEAIRQLAQPVRPAKRKAMARSGPGRYGETIGQVFEWTNHVYFVLTGGVQLTYRYYSGAAIGCQESQGRRPHPSGNGALTPGPSGDRPPPLSALRPKRGSPVIGMGEGREGKRALTAFDNREGGAIY